MPRISRLRLAQVLAGLVEGAAFDGDQGGGDVRAPAPGPLRRGEGGLLSRRRFDRRALEVAAPERELREVGMELRLPEPVHQDAFAGIPVAEGLEVRRGFGEPPLREGRRAAEKERHLPRVGPTAALGQRAGPPRSVDRRRRSADSSSAIHACSRRIVTA